MKLLLSVFATLALTSTPKHQAAAQETESLKLIAYGEEIQIPNIWVQYDQNQNHAEGSNPTFAADHLSLTTVGNRWSSYAIPNTAAGTPVEIKEDSVLQFDFTLGANTVSGFQALCVDADREITGSNGQCFVLSTSQGWIDNMLNVAKQTDAGQTTSHSIPIGHFFTGPINYLAILQDSDGDATAKAAGNSTFANFEIVERGRIPLNVKINDVDTPVENQQFSMSDSGQDTKDFLMAISEDGESIQVNGNQWKALKFTTPYNITSNTVLEFDVIVSDTGDFHSICLDDDLSTSGVDNCATFLTPTSQKIDHLLTTTISANEVHHLVLPFGNIFKLLQGDVRVANYLGFVQDNDVGDKRGGQMTFSSFQLYEEERFPLSIDLYGTETSIPNIQDSMTSSGSSDSYVQDSIDHVMSVSSDGKNMTAHGNSFKRFKLDTPFEIFPSSVLKFTFSVTQGAEIQAICLLAPDEINMQDGRNDCFATGGQDSSDNSAMRKITPLTPEGATQEYEIYVGSYFTGQIGYIGFAQDNDKSYTDSRADGEATWSNIQIYRLPDLNIGFDGSNLRIGNSQLSVAIENNQVTYESTSQDTTPIKDYLAEVSDDGDSITVNGNMWRAFPFSPPKSASELGDFIVSFDYVLKTPGDFHAVCFEDNLEYGNADNPLANGYDPKRCFVLNDFQDLGRTDGNLILDNYWPQVGEPHRYVRNLSKIYDRFYSLGYFVIIQDNDVDKAVGEMVVSNIRITTNLNSCLKGTDFSFTIDDTNGGCTIDNFLAGVQSQMDAHSCADGDPLLELLAFFDVKEEMEVYKEIEHICNSSYEPREFDFTKTISAETQLVREYIDGGSRLNYEKDSVGGNANIRKDAAGIGEADGYASSRLFTWPKHHALDQCDVGAAMCCWVDSRGATLVDDTDVCYVNMKSSRRTAHVADGYSIYGQGDEGAVSCHGFAWGTDKASTASALKGNALFKVGFMNSLYDGETPGTLKGSVEQVPGAPMCGCIDRMPVVTKAKCTKVSAPNGTVNVSHTVAVGKITAAWAFGGDIVYEDCGDLNTHYKSLVDPEGPDAVYIDSRIVGEGNCPAAINDFLSTKGLAMAA